MVERGILYANKVCGGGEILEHKLKGMGRDQTFAAKGGGKEDKTPAPVAVPQMLAHLAGV